MASDLFYEMTADEIYEELQDVQSNDFEEDDYREDRMEQMISRYGY